ncbi:hypothetical protein RAMLITH_17065 [Ramlibacter sp. RBP-2]|uniref:DUF1223 domain-containing protein n=1 Tax=Ramlibacter lithotrophicus TaxID=2606681 RepID=A0A7X6I7L9_9BURK|nr:hypothetical protein [Ramlibacter lithotrophicus]NKE67538.1 hypothetical protein [Ramlibacter lithotrophicus]
MKDLSRPAIIAALLALAAAAAAQPACSSDGQPPAAALLERFINADCDGCWTDVKTAEPGRGELVLDWIVPGRRGDDAPLSAAARDEALARLQALGQDVPAHSQDWHRPRSGRPLALRVAHGLAFNGYIGTSIELRETAPGPWRAWLLLVEALPPGGERSPVARNVVRNVLHVSWDPARGERPSTARPMSIPEGARPERLRVVGLLEDARGRIRGIAQSRCAGR